MVKTVIFDMDGVIIDSEPVHKYAYYKHFDELGIEVSDEMFATFTGNSTKNVYQKLKNTFNIETDVNELVLRKRFLFNEAFDTKEDLYLIDGVEKLIVDLYQNGFELILASSASKGTIARVFNRFNLNQYFTHKISGEDFVRSKPDPAIFVHAANLSIHPKEACIIIEDSTNGVEAAVGAEVFCLGYTSANSKKQDLSKASAIVTDFNAIDAAYIKNLK
ncbi:HAD-IA family hydrolase [Flavobacterium agricola]|uniref:HAD-IA family hydrolase n=1 Tax=Flavobacterium agricola TaxID=2870839 RepID=A0ABY6M1Z7_9FLAO|nr:HAD-IA family hydrolase [Flavobacterium agricola]UYW02561.1 HAD-IA family hydrolase [Flavobacterium agricola]